MTERRRPPRRGRGPRTPRPDETTSEGLEPNPYREEGGGSSDDGPPTEAASERPRESDDAAGNTREERPASGGRDRPPRDDEESAPDDGDDIAFGGIDRNIIRDELSGGDAAGGGAPFGRDRGPRQEGQRPGPGAPNGEGARDRDRDFGRNGRRHRRGRGRGRRPDQQQPQAPVVITATTETRGWFEPSRDGGFIRRAANSYLAEQGDAWIPPHVVRQYGLRRSDLIVATAGQDPRGRLSVVDILTINEKDASEVGIRPEFNALTASYPERKLFLETGRPAKGGAELIRRAVDLIAPIGYGQRALIVAPARAGKTTLLHAITEGIALNHPNAVLLILLVDERPEEVSEAISWGVGEVISSSFDQPAQRHVEVTEMVMARAHRLVETGRDVVIVLDSLTRMGRAHNTVERGSGRTLSGGLDATAMQKPKAFFGSARNIPDSSGGGSLTIIATALVETGSRMDDVIFEEFKGTGNCEIKLDRSLAEKRIYPAIDIGTSGTRREEKLFRADQLDAVYTLRRGLSQMPPQAAMEWLIKRIAATPSNDQLLSGL
jgi:transcription termination factor Rho